MNPIAAPFARGRHARPGVIAVLAAAALARAWHIGARSLWTDEGSTWTAASAKLPELIRLCAQKDASPPLFYMLTALALRLGDGEAQLRLVSFFASLALVWLTYRIARLAASRDEATLAAAITALSPFQLMYAQEARTYTLVAAFATLSLYLYARAALLDRRRAWVPFVAASALALYTQSIALLGVGVQGAFSVISRSGRRRFAPWLIALLAAFALYLPWFFISLAQAGRLSHSHWYLRAPGGHEAFQVLRAVFLSPIPIVTPPPGATLPGLEAFVPRRLAHLVLLLIPIVPLTIALRSAVAAGTRGVVTRLAFGGLFLPLAAVWIVSFKQPLWLPRYFVLVTPMLAVLLARGIVSLPRPARIAWATVLLATGAYACVRYDTDYTKEPWRDAVHRIASASPPGRTAALVPFDVDPFRFYNLRQKTPVAAFEVSHPAVPFASGYTPEQLDEMERAAAGNAAPFDEVWVVVRSPNSEVRRELALRTERAAAIGRVLIERETFESAEGPLRLARYRRVGADSLSAR